MWRFLAAPPTSGGASSDRFEEAWEGSIPFLWEVHRHELPRHTFALIEKSAHTPPIEEPERFDQTLLAWLNGLAATR
jgi:pimeloyl-ACP methyl ester carboxylesterase